MNAQIEQLNERIGALEFENEQLNHQLQAGNDEQAARIADLESRLLWKRLRGKDECYPIAKANFASEGKDFIADNIKAYAEENPDYFDIAVALVTPEAEKDAAKKEFLAYYKKRTATDFADRIVSIDAYEDSDSEYGWGIVRHNGLTVVANLRTISDIAFDGPFNSNGQSYKIINTGSGYKIVGVEAVADPLDVDTTIESVKNNTDKTEPLVWIGIKFVSAEGGALSKNNEEAELFIDIIDQTARKTCRLSFIEIHKETSISGPSILLTFDGTSEEVYREVSAYLVLLNTYRSRIRENGNINAIIATGEIQAPRSARHLTFDQLKKKTNDIGLNIFNTEVLNMMLVKRGINRCIQIGQSIVEKFSLVNAYVVPSLLGTSDYASIYNWNYKYYEYNVVYDDDRNVVPAKN